MLNLYVAITVMLTICHCLFYCSQSSTSLVNTSVVRFFYSSNDQELFLVEPTVRWYEAIGQCNDIKPNIVLEDDTFYDCSTHCNLSILHTSRLGVLNSPGRESIYVQINFQCM